jgi:hypothetical protein
MTIPLFKKDPVRIRGQQEASVYADIVFSREPLSADEPKLDLMEDAVKLIAEQLATSVKPVLSARHSSLMGSKQDQENVRRFLTAIVMNAVANAEGTGKYPNGWQQGRNSVYYALYVVGLFRLGLNLKDLSPLAKMLVEQGKLHGRDFRPLYSKAVRALEFAPDDSTPLAHLGLDSRHWR